MVYILKKKNRIVITHEHLDTVLNVIYHILDAVHDNTYLQDVEITLVEHNMEVSRYYIDVNSLCAVDEGNNRVFPTAPSLQQFREQLVQNKPINIFFPISQLNATEATEVTNIIMSEDVNLSIFVPAEPQDPKQLESKLHDLQSALEQETKRLQDLQTDLITKEDEYIKKKSKIERRKQKLRLDHDRWLEFQRRFYADKKVYMLIKEEMSNGTRDQDDIPEMLRDKFCAFETLANNHKLDTPEEITEYIKLDKREVPLIPRCEKYAALFANNDLNSSIEHIFAEIGDEISSDTDD